MAISAAAAGALGWTALALIERFAARPCLVWTTLALVVFVVSMAGPLSGTGVTTANRVVLVIMHLMLAAVLIVLLSRTALDRREEREPSATRTG